MGLNSIQILMSLLNSLQLEVKKRPPKNETTHTHTKIQLHKPLSFYRGRQSKANGRSIRIITKEEIITNRIE